jgi:ribosomal peptide maturation radical SAM protein 1
MKVALVAMPWAAHFMPSLALGTLAAAVRRDCPQVELTCKNAYLDAWSELDLFYEIFSAHPSMGEWIYGALLYPQRSETVRRELLGWFARQLSSRGRKSSSLSQEFEILCRMLKWHAESLAHELSTEYQVVGVTTVVGQLFSSLLISKKIKERSPDTVIVLGGFRKNRQRSRSVLSEYSHIVDYIVEGEGEQVFPQLLQQIADGQRGVMGRQGFSARPGNHDDQEMQDQLEERILGGEEISDLDQLPIPDFDEYFQRANELGVGVSIPIEGSRGCWWDRTARTQNPLHACYFCEGSKCRYREKTASRLASEMQMQKQRYKTCHLTFADEILRAGGVEELATEIEGTGGRFSFLHQVRANITPRQLLHLWEAGCTSVVVGFEGLADDYLRRLGKGTTTIQNLQVFRTCYELEMACTGDLILGFPGATQREIDETANNIRRYACAYWPPFRMSRYIPAAGSTVCVRPESFGVSLRKSRAERVMLPDDVWERLDLDLYELTDTKASVDWTPVVEARKAWIGLHRRLITERPEFYLQRKPLFYIDGGSFLEIEDNRRTSKFFTLNQLERDIYLFCTEIRGRSQILRQFSSQADREQIYEALASFVEQDLVYEDGRRYLSLAVATHASLAIQRIKQGS